MTASKETRHHVIPRYRGEAFTPPLAALALAVIGGLLMPLAFAPYGYWVLLPVAIAALICASFTRSAGLAALSGLLWGTAAFIPLFAWANIYAGIAPWIALAVFESLFIVAFAVVARLILVRWGITPLTILAIGPVWAAVELARSSVPWGGLPWAASAFAYADSPLVNFAPWIGVPGLAAVTGVLAMLCFATVMALTFRRRRWRNGFGAVWPAAGIVTIVLVALVAARPDLSVSDGERTVSVAGIQGNVNPPPAGSYYLPKEMFGNHVEETERFLSTGEQVDLVIWPEDSTGWDAPNDPARMEVMTSLSERAGAPVLIGSQVPAGEENRLNKAILIDSEGPTGAEYAKRHPVPFGEYIPARGFFSLLTDKTDLVSRDMLPGSEVGVIPVGNAQVGVLICFEIAYEDSVRETVLDGADVLVVQSNNALFGDSNEAIQQRSQAKLFAVLSGRSVIHLSTVGHSVIVTPEGRELDSLDHWTSGTLRADVPRTSGLTPAVAHGEAIRQGTIAAAVIVLLLALLQPARTTKDTSA